MKTMQVSEELLQAANRYLEFLKSSLKPEELEEMKRKPNLLSVAVPLLSELAQSIVANA